MQLENLDIVMMPVNEIIPYWRNPRRNDKTVDALEQRLPKAGFNVPIVVDKNHVVIKGHARLRAAKRLGMEKVPVIISDVSEDIAKADRIADNKIQEMSSWDFGKLDMEVERLPKMQMRSLFVPEEIGELDAPVSPVDFKPVGLDFSGDADPVQQDSPDYGFDGAAPVEAVPVVGGYEHPDFHTPDAGIESPDSPQERGPDRKQLKTICPYCGKVVLINV